MQQSFGTVVIVVCVVAIVIAVVALAGSGRTWSEHGQGGMVMDRDLPRDPPGASAAQREAEIRELLAARNARRVRRGEPPVDVEEELARLTSPGGGAAGEPPASASARGESPASASARGGSPASASGPASVDASLREEVRQLVVARNHRRVRAGKPPLDVDAEVERELARVSEL